jgi:hypothetical protein
MKKSPADFTFKRFHLFILSFALGIFLLLPALRPARTFACACCANYGDWFESKRRIPDFELDIINDLKLSAKAKRYESPDPKGLTLSDADGDFALSLSRKPLHWVLTFKNQKGDKGTLSLNLPRTATFFGADVHDGQAGGGGGPLLYKEVRFEGRVSGTGIFAKGMKPDTRFRLVFQGRGNRCMAAEDFNNWNLRIYGKQADFAFYGTVQKPVSQPVK